MMGASLSTFRDHCRKMATAEHKPDCPSLGPASRPIWNPRMDANGDIEALQWGGFTPDPPKCDGCNTAEDRALFARLADEVDDYQALAVDLFGEASVEPQRASAE